MKQLFKVFWLLAICLLLLCNCKNKNEFKGNSILIDSIVIDGIKEFCNCYKINTTNEHILEIQQKSNYDTLIITISYQRDFGPIFYNKLPCLYGYVDTIPYLFYNGAEKFVKLKEDSVMFHKFIANVFKEQYITYIVEKKLLPPPSVGFVDKLRLYLYKNRLVRKEFFKE